MKLVDILARELKVWPHPGNALGQAVDNSLHLNEHASHGGKFYEWTEQKFTRAEDHHEAFVTRDQWQAAVDALKAEKSTLQEILESHQVNDPKMHAAADAAFDRMSKFFNSDVAEWNGEGLPPVGTGCEFQMALAGWVSATITAVTEKSIVFTRPLFKDRTGLDYENTHEEILPHHALKRFRPIRTPEQIAKQERSKACDKMYGVILDKIPQDRRNNGSDICEALYDAGYRKFEIVDN